MNIIEQIRAHKEELLTYRDGAFDVIYAPVTLLQVKALAESHERLKFAVGRAIFNLRIDVSEERRHRIVHDLLAVLDPAEDLTGQVPSLLKETR